MWRSIDLTKLDKLLEEFKDYGSEGESFSSFIETTKDDETPVWNWVDSVGVVTPQDFEGKYGEDFIEDNFQGLANQWFNNLNSQVDFGSVLECIDIKDG